jgi:hypothetical protein
VSESIRFDVAPDLGYFCSTFSRDRVSHVLAPNVGPDYELLDYELLDYELLDYELLDYELPDYELPDYEFPNFAFDGRIEKNRSDGSLCNLLRCPIQGQPLRSTVT